MKDFRFSNFDTFEFSRLIAERAISGELLSHVTCIVGIASNVEKWPENRSFVSIMKVAEQVYVIGLSHHTEVKVVEVTDRHLIPKALGWTEPQHYGGINIPSWHKLFSNVTLDELAELIRSAIDDLMVTYSHHEEMSENFYLISEEGEYSESEEKLLARWANSLRKLDASEVKRLASSRIRFTDPQHSNYLQISEDDWDDEIGYLPRFAALTNHRGYPLALFRVDVHLFGDPENLRIWNGEKFTKAGSLAKRLCSEETSKRNNFQLISGHLVQQIWPEALKNQTK
jgi:hypothetical protein